MVQVIIIIYTILCPYCTLFIVSLYLTAFAEFESDDAAVKASTSQIRVLGRPAKINLAPVKTSDKGGNNASAEKNKKWEKAKPLSEKPDNCDSLFLGNLSFEITEEAVYEFFGEEISRYIEIHTV